jgi:hypothetical protein
MEGRIVMSEVYNRRPFLVSCKKRAYNHNLHYWVVFGVFETSM